ncbi:MAG: Uma2 family endonuclease [Spirulina sp.]
MIVTAPPPTPSRILLDNISWQTYETLLEALQDQRGLRLTYDRGRLEIMAPLDPHEGYKKLVGRCIETVTEELNLNIRSLGSRTCRRQDLAKGLEPDQCYYIANEAIVRELEQIDLNQDPPPDLVIEIDITSSSLDRMSLYLSLGVPEVWRYDGETLQFYCREEGEYRPVDRSPNFPFLSPNDILRFIEQRATIGETALIRSFRQWVREQM